MIKWMRTKWEENTWLERENEKRVCGFVCEREGKERLGAPNCI